MEANVRIRSNGGIKKTGYFDGRSIPLVLADVQNSCNGHNFLSAVYKDSAPDWSILGSWRSHIICHYLHIRRLGG